MPARMNANIWWLLSHPRKWYENRGHIPWGYWYWDSFVAPFTRAFICSWKGHHPVVRDGDRFCLRCNRWL